MRKFAADPPVEKTLGDRLREAGHTLATVESCTGGLVGTLLTAVPGSSDYFNRAYVAYSYDAKLALGVSREALDDRGAVSEPVAHEMAQRGRDAAGTTWSVAATGVAGPEGGSEQTPVGTVFLAVAYAGEWGSGETHTTAERREFDGSRTAVRERTARRALELVGEELASRNG